MFPFNQRISEIEVWTSETQANGLWRYPSATSINELSLRERSRMKTISGFIKGEKMAVGRGYIRNVKLAVWRRFLIDQDAGYQIIFNSAEG